MSWFRNLYDTSIDLLPDDGFEPWISSDLVQNPIQIAVDPRRFCQIVYAVEAAHRLQLSSLGSLQTRSMLVPGCAFPRSATMGDVYIDDLVIMVLVHFSGNT